MYIGHFGVALALRATEPLDRTGVTAFWTIIGLMAVTFAGNLLGPPPNVKVYRSRRC